MSEILNIIDVEKFRAADRAVRADEAARLKEACRRDGFFYAVNHGLGDMADSFRRAREFFAAPQHVKDKVSIARSDRFQGYEPQNDRDSKEAFVLGPERGPDDPLVRAGTPWHGANAWPDMGEDWRAHFLALYVRMQDTARLFNRALALAFGADEGYFDALSQDPMGALRLLHYPPAQRVEGLAAHTDWGAFSLLAQEDVPGLEILTPDQKWLTVAPLEGALVVNTGELVTRWTNGLLTPTLHRVVNRAPRDRYSIAFFLDMDYHAVIAPLPGCGTPQFAPVTVGQHIELMHERDYNL